MNNALPLVSIIVATFNGEKYLLEQLDSLINQTYENIEIIICDDDSTDGTKNIIKHFAEMHNSVFYYLNIPNLGVNNNFEQGFLKAKGDYIAISDQDDIWKPEKIETLMNLFLRDDIILVHSASAIFENNKLPSNKMYFTGANQMEGNDIKRMLLRNAIAGHNIIFKKKLLTYLLPFPKNVYYDWWLGQVATCHGQIVATKQILAYQRHHENNLTLYKRSTKKQTILEYNERLVAVKTFLSINNLNDFDRNFIQNLLSCLEDLQNKTFSKKLFFYLLKNAPIFFFYKTKSFPFFSYVKTAYRMSCKVNK